VHGGMIMVKRKNKKGPLCASQKKKINQNIAKCLFSELPSTNSFTHDPILNKALNIQPAKPLGEKLKEVFSEHKKMVKMVHIVTCNHSYKIVLDLSRVVFSMACV
jgi:hypothetical protein